MRAWFVEFNEDGKTIHGKWVKTYPFYAESNRKRKGVAIEIPTDIGKTESNYRQVYIYKKAFKREMQKLSQAEGKKK